MTSFTCLSGTPDEAGLRATLTDYFDGLYHGDMDRFGVAFHPLARLWTVAEGTVSAIDYAPYMERCRGRAAPAASGAAQLAEVLELTQTSGDTAHARVRDAFPPRVYINDLTLVRSEGRWQIVAKVYHAET